MKNPTQRRLAKRQRKQLRGANYAMKQSLKHGEDISVAGIEYRGRNPACDFHSFRKIRAGTPFVRTQPKYHYIRWVAP